MAVKKKKATKTFKGTTHLCVILDRSGSMDACKDETIAGFNEFIEGQKNGPDKATLTLTLFNTEVEQRYSMVPVEKAARLTAKNYSPDGWTALHDSIIRTVKTMEPKVKKEDRALCCIITDGQENSSKEYDLKDVQRLIEQMGARGNWSFTFLGADKDAYITGTKMGIGMGNIGRYSNKPGGTVAMAQALSANTQSFRGGSGQHVNCFYSGGVDPLADTDDDPIYGSAGPKKKKKPKS